VFVSGENGKENLVLSNVDGSQETPLTQDGSYNVNPSWSPDSQFIAFQSGQDGVDQINIINTHGEMIATLTLEGLNISEPVWRPVGQ
jgi:Tol biopolymer transport system component